MSIRTEKVSSLLKQEISAIISKEYNTKEYGFITVIDVHVTPDLKIAKVYVSIFNKGEVRDKTLKMLTSKKKHIRTLLGASLSLKYTPDLQFYIDETLDRVEALNEIFKKIHKNDNPE